MTLVLSWSFVIVDVIALAAVNVFENYFNLVARTEIDFPKVRVKLKAA